MSEMENFLALLNQSSSNDNAVRQATEKTIIDAANANPEKFLEVTFQIIEADNLEINSRLRAILVLKKVLYSSTESLNIYKKLAPQHQDAFRRKCLMIIPKLKEDNLKSNFATVIGSLASNIIDDAQIPGSPDSKWPDLIPHLFEICSSFPDENNIAAVFTILESIFVKHLYTYQRFFPEFQKIFVQIFQS